MQRIRELREKRVAIHEQAQELLKKKPMTSEDRQKWNRMMADMDTLKTEIEDLERQQELDGIDAELRMTRRPPEAAIGAGGFDSAQEVRHHRAFMSYLRHGREGMSAEELQTMKESRDMALTPGSSGGFLVPQGFVNKIDVALKYYGNMLGISTILRTASGNPLPYPTSNDTSVVGEIVGENSQVTAADVAIGQILFGAFKFSTKLVKVSMELMQDSAFDMETFLADTFANRLGRILNTKFTLGVGTTEPKGVITAATAGPTAVGSSGTTGGSETGGTSIGYTDLVALEHSVDILYRRNAKYMMHDTTLQKIKQILDKQGRPIWSPGLVALGAPDTILGYPYSINNDMAAVAVNAKSVAFGAFEKYVIRQVKELAVLRLVERFADYGQVAFIGFARFDGQLVDAGTHPIKYLVQAATLLATTEGEPAPAESGAEAASHKSGVHGKSTR